MRRLRIFIAALAFTPFVPFAAAVSDADLAAARTLFAERRLGEAQAAFEKLAAAAPAHPEINYHLGELALRRNAPEQAAPLLEKAVAAAPAVSRYYRRLGDAYGTQAANASIFHQLGLAKKCLAAYEKAVALDGNDVDARLSLFEYYRRAPGFAGGGFDKAAAQAEAVKKLDPLRGRIAYATLYAGEKKYAEAFAQFEEVLKTQPDDYVALYHVGRIAATTGQSAERGVAALRRCLELPVPAGANVPGPAAVHWRLGQLHEKLGDKPAARAAYEAAVQSDPKFTAAADALAKLR